MHTPSGESDKVHTDAKYGLVYKCTRDVSDVQDVLRLHDWLSRMMMYI